MQLLMVLFALGSALGAYQFFLWLYKRKYTPNILIGVLPYYEIINEGENIELYGRYCIANEFIFDPASFAEDYNIERPEAIDRPSQNRRCVRKVFRNKEGNCNLPIIIQNLGKGFCKDLFYVVTFYEKQSQGRKKSYGKIRINNIITERPNKCYLYVSKDINRFDTERFYLPNELICKIYNDIGLPADYIYFETFLEPKAFILNVVEINLDIDIKEFVILFNIFSLQNERILISKYQYCAVINEK